MTRFYFCGMPASLQAFFGTVTFFIIYYCYRGIGMMTRWAEEDREPVMGTVANILEARISEAPEATS